jgi:hypothetical protein
MAPKPLSIPFARIMDMKHLPFSVFKRTGRRFYLVKFRNEETGEYLPAVSTKKNGVRGNKDGFSMAQGWYTPHRYYCREWQLTVQKYWLPFFKGRLLRDITKKDIETFIDSLVGSQDQKA